MTGVYVQENIRIPRQDDSLARAGLDADVMNVCMQNIGYYHHKLRRLHYHVVFLSVAYGMYLTVRRPSRVASAATVLCRLMSFAHFSA